MRRSALIATVSIVSILALSACGGGNDSPTSADAVEAEGETPQQPESDPGEPEILVPISDPGVPAVEAPVVTEAIIPAEQVAEVVLGKWVVLCDALLGLCDALWCDVV